MTTYVVLIKGIQSQGINLKNKHCFSRNVLLLTTELWSQEE